MLVHVFTNGSTLYLDSTVEGFDVRSTTRFGANLVLRTFSTYREAERFFNRRLREIDAALDFIDTEIKNLQ